MNDDLPEESEPRYRLPRLQFGLRTLFAVTTVFAVLCALVAWCGPIPVVLALGYAAGTFLGLLACAFLGLEYPLDDARWDIVKCLILGVVVISSAYGIVCLISVRQAVLGAIVGAGVLAKIFWQELGVVEIAIIGFAALLTMALSAVVLRVILGV